MQLSDFVRDSDGFLTNPDNWSEEFARLVAKDEGLEYTEELNAVVMWARTHFIETGQAPAIRDFGQGFYAEKFGKTDRKGPPKYLAGLTSGTGMKAIDKIAGLPKPTGCV